MCVQLAWRVSAARGVLTPLLVAVHGLQAARRAAAAGRPVDLQAPLQAALHRLGPRRAQLRCRRQPPRVGRVHLLRGREREKERERKRAYRRAPQWSGLPAHLFAGCKLSGRPMHSGSEVALTATDIVCTFPDINSYRMPYTNNRQPWDC